MLFHPLHQIKKESALHMDASCAIGFAVYLLTQTTDASEALQSPTKDAKRSKKKSLQRGIEPRPPASCIE
jgi:hypothetical protein